jgi:sulfotransferase family protein
MVTGSTADQRRDVQPMKVLYIAGWGRSGSTIVDNILGSYDSVFSVGELYYLWRRGLGQGRRCGCGEPLPECPLWREVLALAYRDSELRATETNKIQRRAVRVRDTWRLSHGHLGTDASQYRDELGRIYSALGAVTGAELIVDSSKVPAGAAVAAQIDGIEAYLLQMVRDPRAVAYSWMRPKVQPDSIRQVQKVPRQMDQHSAARSSVNWVAWNLLTEEVARSGYADRFHRLRYEDFIADPQAAIADVFRLVGMPANGTPFVDGATVKLAGNHTVSGNPSRFDTGPVALRADDKWRRGQSRRDRLVSTATALPLLHRYGYVVAPTSSPESADS